MLQAQILECDAEQQVNTISQKSLPGQANVIRQAAKTVTAVDVCFFLLQKTKSIPCCLTENRSYKIDVDSNLGFFFFTPIFITVEASLKKGSLTCFCSFQPRNGADSDVVFLVWAVREK